MQKSGTACSSLVLREMETASVVVCGLYIYCTETAAMEAVQQRMERFKVNTDILISIYLYAKIWILRSKEATSWCMSDLNGRRSFSAKEMSMDARVIVMYCVLNMTLLTITFIIR